MPTSATALCFQERRRDHGERDRHDHRSAGAGQHTERDELCRRGGQRGQHVGDSEHAQPCEQDVLATEAIADGADGHQQCGEGDGVAVDHPQQLALSGAEVAGQLLLSNVEAGDGSDHRHQRRAHRDQDHRAATSIGHLRLGGLVLVRQFVGAGGGLVGHVGSSAGGTG